MRKNHMDLLTRLATGLSASNLEQTLKTTRFPPQNFPVVGSDSVTLDSDHAPISIKRESL